MAKRSVVALVKRYAQVLMEHGFPVSAVYLYGSHVHRRAAANSDIDVLVVSPVFDVDRYSRVGELWRLTRLVDTRIEPLPAGEKAFAEDQITPLYEIVRQEGIRVV